MYWGLSGIALSINQISAEGEKQRHTSKPSSVLQLAGHMLLGAKLCCLLKEFGFGFHLSSQHPWHQTSGLGSGLSNSGNGRWRWLLNQTLGSPLDCNLSMATHPHCLSNARREEGEMYKISTSLGPLLPLLLGAFCAAWVQLSGR